MSWDMNDCSVTSGREHLPARSIRRQLLNEIPDVVSTKLYAHLKECENYARRAVQLDLQKVDAFYNRERRARERCIRDRKWYRSQKVKQRMWENHQRDLTHVDPSALSLHTIITIPISMERTKSRGAGRRSMRSRYGGVSLPRALEIPHYDAWIPVLVNYWVGKELHVEPYMPFLGDQDNECEAAFEVYEDMAGDAGKEVELSDGELNDSGNFSIPRIEDDRINYFSMASTRWREASRKAILSVLDKYEQPDENMWRILAQALGMKSVPRLKAVARVAEERKAENLAMSSRRSYVKQVEQDIQRVWTDPEALSVPPEEELTFSSNALKHFCFTCHMIPCAQHAGFDIEPVMPIEDLPALKREEQIAEGKAKICSPSCGLRTSTDKIDKAIDLTFDYEWSPEEITILRDAVTVFGMDPCALAIVIGSRSCAQVAARMKVPVEFEILQQEIHKSREPKKRTGAKRKSANSTDKKDKANSASKTFVDLSDVRTTDQDFEPCDHAGPCSAEFCSCVKKGMYCETTCGCNYGRYGQGGATGGIVWLPPSEKALEENRVNACGNRHYGCNCENGNCTSSSCPCWETYRACSPDWCLCDVTCLPGHVSLQKRQCRNGPIIVGRHKRTFIGKSDVHGFGLFAGEAFEEGDLVGVYSGQLIDTRLADMIGRIYDATNRTYIFNVTESLVIDGGLLGSKAKFCNHTKPGHRENCASRLVRVRGDAYVALFCKRNVKPGEEFLFDYRFTGEVPAWAKEEIKSKQKK